MSFIAPDLTASGIRCLGTIETDIREPEPPDQLIGQAIAQSAGLKACRPGESVCIVVSDQTRKTAVDQVLPILTDKLTRNGCSLNDMFILFASGVHRHPTPREMEAILGPKLAVDFKERIFCHDADDSASLAVVGKTQRGQVVRINRRAVEADRLILTGGVVYHYHAGFGGGRKSLVPGLAARDTIAHNHSLSLDPEVDRIHPHVGPGKLKGNPIAEEMTEAALLCAPDFVINTVLLPDGRVAGAFCGEMVAAHGQACDLAKQIYGRPIAERADIVIASAGNATTWIQSHKALFNASRAVTPDGRIILWAPCTEGLGDERFRHWITNANVTDIFRGLRENPEILGQTALSTKTRGKRTVLVTQMAQTDVTDLGIATATDMRSALDKVVAELGKQGKENPTCYIMPEAAYTVPFFVE